MLVALAATMLLSGCKKMMKDVVEPSEKHVKKECKVDAFEKIKTTSAIKVVYMQTEGEQKVVLDVPENIINMVDVNVHDKELEVSFTRGGINGSHNTTLYVSAPSVRSFKASSVGSIVLTNGVKTDGEVAIKASSAANVIVEKPIYAKLIYIDASSAATVDVAGAKAETFRVEASSAATIDIDGIFAKTLSAEASSAATITLDGQCDIFSNKSSSAGEVNAKRLKAKQQ